MARPKAEPEGKQTQISFRCDRDLRADIIKRAAADGTTLRAIMMRALKTSGFDVPPDDLDDKRK